MKVLVTGAAGQLGCDVMAELAKRGHTAVGCDIAAACSDENRCTPLDITDGDAVSRTLAAVRPDAAIHCAAWTAVDAAEEPANAAAVHAVNVAGTRNLAQACKAAGAKLMYISTDYVFDGSGDTPWQADCTEFAPLSVYGKTKLNGEQAVAETLQEYFIVRIAWAFGVHGKNFVRTMLNVGRQYPAVRVVCDQIGTPTYTHDLACLLVDMIATDRYGCYHATNEGGYISWYDFACEIFRQAGLDTPVIPVTTAEYGLTKAARPMNSRLDKSKLREAGFTPLPDWKDALSRYLAEIGEKKA